ncbi:hypothetical protein MHYP_G00032220 [Metynnis hypsauchen]
MMGSIMELHCDIQPADGAAYVQARRCVTVHNRLCNDRDSRGRAHYSSPQPARGEPSPSPAPSGQLVATCVMTSPLCSLIGWRTRPASPIAGRRGDVNNELPAKIVRRGAGRRGAYVGGRVNRAAVIGCDRIRGEGLLLREKRARVEREKQQRRGASADSRRLRCSAQS